MKLNQLRKIIREEVRAAVKEELQDVINEAVKIASTPTKMQPAPQPGTSDWSAAKPKMDKRELAEMIGLKTPPKPTNITFSKKGIIKLGDFLSVQRKGGNGKHIKIPKTDWNHPGNQLQFKISPVRFANYVKEEKVIDFCEINYKF